MENGRWVIGNAKWDMGNRIWEVGDGRWEIGDQRLEIGDLRLEIENEKKIENRRQKMRYEKRGGNKIVDICLSLNLKASYNKGLETGVPWNTRECK